MKSILKSGASTQIFNNTENDPASGKENSFLTVPVIPVSAKASQKIRKSVGRRVSFATTAHVRLFDSRKEQNDENKNFGKRSPQKVSAENKQESDSSDEDMDIDTSASYEELAVEAPAEIVNNQKEDNLMNMEDYLQLKSMSQDFLKEYNSTAPDSDEDDLQNTKSKLEDTTSRIIFTSRKLEKSPILSKNDHILSIETGGRGSLQFIEKTETEQQKTAVSGPLGYTSSSISDQSIDMELDTFSSQTMRRIKSAQKKANETFRKSLSAEIKPESSAISDADDMDTEELKKWVMPPEQQKQQIDSEGSEMDLEDFDGEYEYTELLKGDSDEGTNINTEKSTLHESDEMDMTRATGNLFAIKRLSSFCEGLLSLMIN